MALGERYSSSIWLARCTCSMLRYMPPLGLIGTGIILFVPSLSISVLGTSPIYVVAPPSENGLKSMTGWLALGIII